MNEMDEAWEQLRQDIELESLMHQAALENIYLSQNEDPNKLYQLGREKLDKIVFLCIEEDRIRCEEVRDLVRNVKIFLYFFCVNQNQISLYPDLIETYKQDFGREQNPKFEAYYRNLVEELDVSLN